MGRSEVSYRLDQNRDLPAPSHSVQMVDTLLIVLEVQLEAFAQT